MHFLLLAILLVVVIAIVATLGFVLRRLLSSRP